MTSDYNAILDSARDKGETRIVLKWDGKDYPFSRTVNAQGWDTHYQLPASFWGELRTANINGGETND